MGAAELAEVQRLDDRLVDLRREVAAIEARLRGSAELEAARHTAAEREADLRGAQAGVDDADRRAAELRRRATTLERQLYGGSVRNPAELLTLDRELAEVKAKLAAEEDEELGRMEQAELAGQAAAEARAALEAVERRRAAEAGPDADRLVRLGELIADTTAERDLARSRRSPQELSLYDRLAGRLHPAVARLGAGDVCSGCRTAVSPTLARTVRLGEGMPQCPNCDRLLAR